MNATEFKLDTVTGPRSGLIHYVYFGGTGPLDGHFALCGKVKPRYGWLVTTDDQNNANRSGFCEACIRKAAYG